MDFKDSIKQISERINQKRFRHALHKRTWI